MEKLLSAIPFFIFYFLFFIFEDIFSAILITKTWCSFLYFFFLIKQKYDLLLLLCETHHLIPDL